MTSAASRPIPVVAEEDPPFLLLVAGTQGRQVFLLSEREMLVGRAPSCGIRLSGEGVSREHAKIARDGDELTIEDLQSSNGTFLNGERIQGRYRLAAGDRIRIGGELTFRLEWPMPDESGDDRSTTTMRTPTTSDAWTPFGWRDKPSKHLPAYDDPNELEQVIGKLHRLPPLVTSWEIERLKGLIAEAQEGKRLILQGGDCAETLDDCQDGIITGKLKILLQMSLVITHAARKPVIRLGRFAGQYAKPRSSPTEVRGNVTLPSYLGDLVNRPGFDAESRRPDPQLLLAGYYHASLTLNFIRSLCGGGFSDLRRPEYFDLTSFARDEGDSELRQEYALMSQQISEGLHFLRAMGDKQLDELTRVEFFASHEGLNLNYEAAQTRTPPRRSSPYCLTTHLPWIGERTRALDGAHIEFFRGIANPIGIKIGPSITPTELVELVRALNPQDEPGKIVLIVRMGAGNVPVKLPPLVEALRRARRRVLWTSDPMHGNGMVTSTGVKTRDFRAILQELEEAIETHDRCGSIFGGVHFELTGEDVTECIGGGLSETDLDLRYLTACDPRLNQRQALEMAFLIARRINRSSVRRPDTMPPPSSPRLPR